MSEISLNTVFSIRDIYQQVFGYQPAVIPKLPDYMAPMESAVIQASNKKTETLYGQPLYAKDLLGYEVFCPVTIESDGRDYFFPYTVLGFSRSLVTVETEMTELNGSVDEIISLSNFQISMRGFLIGQFEQFPDDEIKMLNDVFTAAKVVRLKSAYSDLFLHRNDNILIKKMDVPEASGVIGVRPFALQAKESNIFTLYQS